MITGRKGADCKNLWKCFLFYPPARSRSFCGSRKRKNVYILMEKQRRQNGALSEILRRARIDAQNYGAIMAQLAFVSIYY
jgi:hypothetical protein